MNKKTKSTTDEFIESLSPKERKKFDEELKEFALSELILALMECDEVSVRKLAKMAGISPTVVQAMHSNTKIDYKIMKRSKNFDAYLIERLRDPKKALSYLNAILEECKECDKAETKKLILHALKNIAEAQKGITKLVKKS